MKTEEEEPGLGERKLQKEIEKLDLEIAALRRPLARPETWLAILPVILAITAALTAWTLGVFDNEAKRLAAEKLQLKADTTSFTSQRDFWNKFTHVVLNEPSGLTSSPFHDRTGAPLAVAVDDEEPHVFVLRRQKTGEQRMIVVHRAYPLDEETVDDLEGVVYVSEQPDSSPEGSDPLKADFFLLGSHREHPAEAPSPSGLVRVSLWRDPLRVGEFTMTVDEVINLHSDAKPGLVDLLSPIVSREDRGRFGKDLQNGEEWSEARGSLFPIELEGLAYDPRDQRLFVGLRWPRAEAKKRAILLKFDPELRTWADPICLDLGGLVISGLTLDRKLLYIAASQPGKKKYERARLYRCRLDFKPLECAEYIELDDNDVKPEGLAMIYADPESGDGALWSVHEGRRADFRANEDLLWETAAPPVTAVGCAAE